MEWVGLDRRAMLGAGLALPLTMTTARAALAQEAEPALSERLAPMARFLGTWRGEGDGQPGRSTVERTYSSVLGGRFIFVGNRSTYAPQEGNPNGEDHEDQGFYSFDRARNRAVLRQFLVEGFFAQYVAGSEVFDGAEVTFLSEAVENIPNGFRARETYRFSGLDASRKSSRPPTRERSPRSIPAIGFVEPPHRSRAL
jgi:hypothetical protein